MTLAVLGIWLAFAACLALVGVAGPVLSRNGDVLAVKLNLSGSWVGLILVASITSLPELTTGISAVSFANAPDTAVGDIFGSCVFNLAILIVLDFMLREESVYRRVRQGHILSAAFGIMLIGLAALSLVLHGQGMGFSAFGIGGYTPIMFLLYALGVRAVFTYEKANQEQRVETVESLYSDISLAQAIRSYAIAGALIVATGTALPFVAVKLAALMGWQQTFVGTLFVAAVTSLPELIVSAVAVRIGAVDMAIANLLGSNMFNILILGIDDLFYRQGPILSHVSPIHIISALSCMVMSGLVIAGLLYRPQGRLFRTVGWISFGLFTMYLLNSYVLYLHGAR
ncbi:sodium:calcium antiporter [Acidocella aminolytica]|jgi:cation:H+ antiporter|uniref:Sodium/calcium exchanger membrane region n=1 Tax=Acidocella aminolytica 101 = DSM 11237 TaxID=1120923 RepID=A0A0D6PEN1_9PROT|nr:sodium:calcium antiporter [Acidocella aminolytica]GAN79658.1 sodium/calcium exchanger membrane region [Acidocella aminolytica 101 = DSM 11237]GBQ41326.1 Ca2+/Na+ antiporter [Acidocella aminolytica 101 = DSM 11237]SHF05325.1 cation:H+ antiporter [Acidocella aminolytica 101 = DSM 11237]